MASRRKFDLSTLDLVLERDGAKTNFDRSLPVLSKTVITFTCSCEIEHTKRFDQALDYGMFCKDCMAEKAIERSKNSAIQSKANVLQLAESYLLVLDDGTERVVLGCETLSLVVTSKYLNSRMYLQKYNSVSYMVAVYWDQTKHSGKSRKFRVRDGDAETQQAAAQAFLGSLTPIPKTYRVTKTMQQLAENPSWAEKYLRLAPPVTEYADQDVPIDPYLLGLWLGDGAANRPSLHNIEPQIIEYWYAWASANGCEVVHYKDSIEYNIIDPGQKNNKLIDALRQLGIFCAKAIPRVYIENSVDVRMKVVAGLLDTDGSLDAKATKQDVAISGVSYDFIQSAAHENIFDGFREIVHSLGWRMSKNACLKSCKGKDGIRKKFPAFRGQVVGGDSMQDLPILTPRKKITRSTKARRDLHKFKIMSVGQAST